MEVKTRIETKSLVDSIAEGIKVAFVLISCLTPSLCHDTHNILKILDEERYANASMTSRGAKY